MDIPGVLKPDFAASPCCWSPSHSMHTRVRVTKSALFHAPPWQLRQGKRLPTKGSTRLPPTFPPVAGDGSDGSGGGGVAGVFPFS
jgi:hypothetical protein